MGNEMLDGISGENTLLVAKTLRSGQSVRHSGSVVVLGDVNPGAEVMAGGHVVVMGTVRGTVYAGTSGDESATITAFCLIPTQLGIARLLSSGPGEPRSCPEVPETARLKDGVLIIEKYQPPR